MHKIGCVYGRAKRKAPDHPAAELYYAKYVRPPAAEGSAQAALQEAINEKAKLEADLHYAGSDKPESRMQRRREHQHPTEQQYGFLRFS